MTKIASMRIKIQETETYQGLQPIVQKIMMTRNNVKHIEHGFVVAQNIGLTKWKKQSNYTWRNIAIIEELLKKYPKNVS